MNASSPARFDSEPQECAFSAGFRPSNLGIEWNAENQLKRVLKNAATIATFAYDPLGRRVEKVAGGTTTTFTYDGEDILRESAGATTTYYVHGPGIDEPLAKEISGSSTYYHADALGSVLKMTNAAGTVTHEYRYDAFGKIEAGSTQGGHSFTGREWDSEIGLFYYRSRYYDPNIGRFISEDPIGLLGGPNLYTMVWNNPVGYIDPTWLWGFSLGLEGVAGAAGFGASANLSAKFALAHRHVLFSHIHGWRWGSGHSLLLVGRHLLNWE
jgi:RHS repeat-associated protein